MVPQMLFCPLRRDEDRVSVVADRDDVTLATTAADRSRRRIEINEWRIAKITFLDYGGAAALVVTTESAGAARSQLNRKIRHFACVGSTNRSVKNGTQQAAVPASEATKNGPQNIFLPTRVGANRGVCNCRGMVPILLHSFTNGREILALARRSARFSMELGVNHLSGRHILCLGNRSTRNPEGSAEREPDEEQRHCLHDTRQARPAI